MLNKIIIVLGLILFLSACGKVSKPIAPEGSTYPRAYVVTQN